MNNAIPRDCQAPSFRLDFCRPNENRAPCPCFADYSLSASIESGPKIHIRRALTVLKSRIPVSQYPVLKFFFDQARAGDEGQIVLMTGTKEDARRARSRQPFPVRGHLSP
jgi:hypothetical protein